MKQFRFHLPTGDTTLTRQSILRVSINTSVNRGLGALAGLAIGAGSGAALGQLANNARPHEPDIHGARNGAIVGMLVGAGVGALVHVGGGRDVYGAR